MDFFCFISTGIEENHEAINSVNSARKGINCEKADAALMAHVRSIRWLKFRSRLPPCEMQGLSAALVVAYMGRGSVFQAQCARVEK
jgi:hypothetical protein